MKCWCTGADEKHVEAKEKLANKEKPKGPPPGIRQYINYCFIFILLHLCGAVLCPFHTFSDTKPPCGNREHPETSGSKPLPGSDRGCPCSLHALSVKAPASSEISVIKFLLPDIPGLHSANGAAGQFRWLYEGSPAPGPGVVFILKHREHKWNMFHFFLARPDVNGYSRTSNQLLYGAHEILPDGAGLAIRDDPASHPGMCEKGFSCEQNVCMSVYQKHELYKTKAPSEKSSVRL